MGEYSKITSRELTCELLAIGVGNGNWFLPINYAREHFILTGRYYVFTPSRGLHDYSHILFNQEEVGRMLAQESRTADHDVVLNLWRIYLAHSPRYAGEEPNKNLVERILRELKADLQRHPII